MINSGMRDYSLSLPPCVLTGVAPRECEDVATYIPNSIYYQRRLLFLPLCASAGVAAYMLSCTLAFVHGGRGETAALPLFIEEFNVRVSFRGLWPELHHECVRVVVQNPGSRIAPLNLRRNAAVLFLYMVFLKTKQPPRKRWLLFCLCIDHACSAVFPMITSFSPIYSYRLVG